MGLQGDRSVGRPGRASRAALEPWFVCAAHSDEDVATTLQVFEESLSEALAAT